MGIIAKIAAGLKKTKDSFLGRLKRIFNSFTKIDEELFEELEEAMIMSDIGVETSVEICESLRKKIKERGITDPNDIMELIQEVIGEVMGDDTGLDLTQSPAVIMVIGVNGAGKTTTIGKLCYQFKKEKKKVLVAAADTFRAAAIDQLEVWTERAGVEIVKHAEGSDPGAVVYDALEAAKARNCDVVIIDTAGRLHNKKNLMDELAKINRIIDNKAGDCSREVLLVLDATTGQNAVNQAKLFSETAPITGIVLTKLDGTAKGGIVISIKNELGIPVKLIGIGEKIDDLQPFDSRTFVQALFSDTDFDDEDDIDEMQTDEGSEELTEESFAESDNDFDECVNEENGEEYADNENYEEYENYAEAGESEIDDVELKKIVETAEIDENVHNSEDHETENNEKPENPDEADYNDNIGVDNNEDAEENNEENKADDSGIMEEEKTEEENGKKKKKGFFKRLFGRKDDDDDQ